MANTIKNRFNISALLDAGVGVVVVDALEVLGLDPVPRDVLVRLELEHHIADEILDKNRVFVGALSHRFFVGTLEQRIQFAASLFF